MPEKSRPLKVTAHLIDGRVSTIGGIIMFDSILYHAWYAKHRPEVLEGIHRPERATYVGLPLAQLKGNRWEASCGIYQEEEQSIEYWNKRPEFFSAAKQGYLNTEQGVISSKVGKFRAYRTPMVVKTIEGGLIDFYCVGRPGKIMDLLSYIPALGKKAAMGFGLVDKWTIKDAKENYSFMHPEYGLMRPTPVDEISLEGYPVMNYAVKPPYWKPKNMRLCYVPKINR